MLERFVEMLGGHSLHVGYGFVFVILLLCGFGLPMPEDIILVTGGVLAYLASPLRHVTLTNMWGDAGLLAMICVGLGGILAGDSVIFLAGRRFGARVADLRPLRSVITPEKLELVERRVRTHGNYVVFVARFLPGLRAPTFFTVGHLGMPFWKFFLYDGIAALVSAPLWVCIGFYFGSNLKHAARLASQFSHWILIGLAVVGLALLFRWLQQRRAGPAAPAASPAGAPEAERD